GDTAMVEKAARLLRDRLTAAGYRGVQVSVPEPGRVRVTAAGPDVTAAGLHVTAAGPGVEGLPLLATPGRLTIRAVRAGPVRPRPVGRAGEPDLEVRPAEEPDGDPDPRGVASRLGPAYRLAEGLTDPDQADPATAPALAPFGELTPAEVGTLPSTMQ